MRHWMICGLLSGGMFLAFAYAAAAHEDADKLPPGPIRDRHELMEKIGDHAEKIGLALKTKDNDEVVPNAEAIAEAAKKIPALFPPGSTNPHSRAKPEIWANWKQFEETAAKLHVDAIALAKAAREDIDEGVASASRTMFGDCKSCHQNFRVPKEGE